MNGCDSRTQEMIVLSSEVSFSAEPMQQNNPLKICVYLNGITLKMRIYCSLMPFVTIFWECLYLNSKSQNWALKLEPSKKNKQKNVIKADSEQLYSYLSEISLVHPFKPFEDVYSLK